MELNFAANRSILQHLRRDGGRPLSAPPEEVPNVYQSLGCHPDLVARLWDKITSKLPERCAWVVCGAPALVHPKSGIIFGFANGTHTYALRIPEPERSEAVKAGATRQVHYPGGQQVLVDSIGPDWVLLKGLENEEKWCLAAYMGAEA